MLQIINYLKNCIGVVCVRYDCKYMYVHIKSNT
jgi:hypothetical protein